MTAPYVIFFRGIEGLIDVAAAERLAKNRGCTAIFYRYTEWTEAVGRIAENSARLTTSSASLVAPRPMSWAAS